MRAGRFVPELLAPAGGYRALLAAVAAGADAVYVGLGGLNARVSAEGFAPEVLARACAVAHERGVRVYAALNVYVFDDEFDVAFLLVDEALRCGVDAFIVADLGLIDALRERFPGIEIHLSTQAGVHAPEGVRLMAEELGVSRVTVARELPVEEIAELCRVRVAEHAAWDAAVSPDGCFEGCKARPTGACGPGDGRTVLTEARAAGCVDGGKPVDIEVFVHGAICISYSGACAFSALCRGRSAMRGDCTQPCRASYSLVDEAGNDLAAVEGDKLLCPRDYLGIAHIPELCQAGVAALKIEGRMKNPDYVYNVVRCYRTALDAYAAGEPIDVDALTTQLGHSFNRGYTDAYLCGARPNNGFAAAPAMVCDGTRKAVSSGEIWGNLRGDYASSNTSLDGGFMSYERSINQGVRVGRVVARGHDALQIEFSSAVGEGDTLEVRFYPGANTAPDAPKRWPMLPCPQAAQAGELLWVHCKRRVEPGAEVFLTRDAGLLVQTEAALKSLDPSLEPVGKRAKKGAGSGVKERVLTSVGASPLAAMDQKLLLDEMLRPDNRAETLSKIDVARQAGKTVVCRNLAQVALCRAQGASFSTANPIFCGNARTEALLKSWGAREVLRPDELACTLDGAQLMVMEHCILNAQGPCSGACARCERRMTPCYLVDQAGRRLRVVVDHHGRSRIFLP